jgi:hypothetical protein
VHAVFGETRIEICELTDKLLSRIAILEVFSTRCDAVSLEEQFFEVSNLPGKAVQAEDCWTLKMKIL